MKARSSYQDIFLNCFLIQGLSLALEFLILAGLASLWASEIYLSP